LLSAVVTAAPTETTRRDLPQREGRFRARRHREPPTRPWEPRSEGPPTPRTAAVPLALPLAG